MEQTANNPLAWRDFSADEVYSAALMEYDMREAVALTLARSAYTTTPLGSTSHQDTARQLLANHEARAESWLADQAAVRGLVNVRMYRFGAVAHPDEVPETTESFSAWLDAELRATKTSASQIARDAGMSRANVSSLRNGLHNPGHEAALRISTALADDKGLEGEARSRFIREAMHRAKYIA